MPIIWKAYLSEDDMRIDLNRSQPSEIVPDAKTQKVSAGLHTNPSQVADDKATLSGNPINVPALEAKALAQPEMRQARVNALRHSIQNGEYKVDSEEVAEAILENQKR